MCDAGGSTVDISAYKVKTADLERFDLKELDVPGCLCLAAVHVHGSY